MLTPFCGTVDFERWEKAFGDNVPTVDGTPITRYWLIPPDQRPKMFMPHPTMNSEEMRAADAGRVGSVLQFRRGLEAVELHAEFAGAPGVHFHFEAVPADVCEHRHRHR